MIITIDGPVASGKSTLAKNLSKEIGAFYICSGLFYRASAYIISDFLKIDLKNENEILNSINKIKFTYLNDENCSPIIIYNDENITKFLHAEEVANNASIISPLPTLRLFINNMQRSYLNNKNYNSIIIDGRDCGITVFPNANLKFYITASLNTRIIRIKSRGSENESANKRLADLILQRDLRDSTRKISPSMPAFDAYIIDTSYMEVDEVLTYTKKLVGFV